MKKTIAMILAFALMLSLTACGSSVDTEVKEPSNVATGSTKAAKEEEKEVAEPEPVTIEEVVLVKEAGVKITAKALETDGLFGPEVKLLIENNSGRDLTFQCRYASVNGYMVETMMSVDVVNGKKANDSLTFMASELDTCGIDTIADMEFGFHIFDMADWETYLDTELVQIKTSIADSYTYSYDDSGNLAYEGNGVRIVIKGLTEEDSIFGPSIVVYIENTGDQDITVQARNVSINGFMVDALFSCDVMAGKRAVDTITFMETELEANEITEISDVELSFHIFDLMEWETIVDTNLVNMTF